MFTIFIHAQDLFGQIAGWLIVRIKQAYKFRKLIFVVLSLSLLLSDRYVVPAEAMTFPNGGFETNPTGEVNDWTSWPTGWGWDGSTYNSGSHSARVSRSQGSASGSLWSANVSVMPSTEYTLTYWIRTSNATWYPRVILYQYTSSSQTGPYIVAYANIGNGTNGWKMVSYRFQTMPDANRIRLRLYLETDTTGTFWFDDFNLLQAAGPARFPFQTGFPVVASGSVWLSSPSVADINQDGTNEVLIGAGNAVYAWDKMGVPLQGFPLSTNDRLIIAQIALADLDQDGRMEIVAGTRSLETEGQCRVFVWRYNGTLLSGWPKSVAWNTQYSNSNCWITSVVLADIDGDQDLEILASSTNNGAVDPYANLETPNLYAWHANGSLVSGNWPNQQTTAGIYGAIAVGDVSGDRKADVVVGRDYLYLNAYNSNGLSLPGWPIRTFVNRNNGNYDTEQRIEYSVNAPIIADVDGNGITETIVAGHVKGPGDVDTKLNSALLVLEPDGTRRLGWETAALGNGILTQVDLPWQAPAVADLNSDGQLEIVVATEDGWIRAHQADKTPLWSFNYTQGAKLFAGEPVIGDIDEDGAFEIVFGTYVPTVIESDKDGPVGLWALEADGTVAAGFPLVIPTPGIRSAPTLADLDGDGKLEILAATRSGQVFAWHTEMEFNALNMPWPTGRHDLRRSATYTSLNPFETSFKSASSHMVKQGENVTFTIRMSNSAPSSSTLFLTDIIPVGVDFVPGTLHASTGTATIADRVIKWTGILLDSQTVDVTYDVIVTTGVPQVIQNIATINTGTNGQLTRTERLYANFIYIYLPEVRK